MEVEDNMTHFRAIWPPFPPFYHPRPYHHFRALAGIQYKLNGIPVKLSLFDKQLDNQCKTNIATALSFRIQMLQIMNHEIKTDNISDDFMLENLPSKMSYAENEKEINQKYNMLEIRQKARMKSFARLIKNLYSNEFISSDEILNMIIELIRQETDISYEFFCIILKIMLKNQNFVTEILNAEKAKIISEHLKHQSQGW